MYNIYRPNRQSVQDTAVSLAERPKPTGHCGLIGWEPQTYRALQSDWPRAPNLQDTAVWLAETVRAPNLQDTAVWLAERPKQTSALPSLIYFKHSKPVFVQEPVLGENGTKHWSCELACSSLESQSDDLTTCQLFYMCIYTKWQWSLHLNWAASQKFCVLRAWFQELVKGMSTVQNELKKLPKVCPLLKMNSRNCQQTFDKVRMNLNIIFTVEFISQVMIKR